MGIREVGSVIYQRAAQSIISVDTPKVEHRYTTVLSVRRFAGSRFDNREFSPACWFRNDRRPAVRAPRNKRLQVKTFLPLLTWLQFESKAKG